MAAFVLAFCRWTIGITFVVSAAGKLASMTSFRAAITDFEVLPARWVRPAGTMTVLLELLAALLVLLGGPVLLAGFALACLLLIGFSLLLARSLRRRAAVRCNCFGRTERPITGYDLVRNGILIGIGVLGGWLWLADGGGLPPIGLLLAGGLLAGTLVALASNLHDIVELLRRPYVVD